jgi:hypothetical protein
LLLLSRKSMAAGIRKILVYRPAQVWLTAAAGAVFLVSAGWLLFELGGQQAQAKLTQLQRERHALERRVGQQEAQLTALREQLAVFQRSSEIDRQASLEVRDDFGRLQDQLSRMRKELDFYRGIVSPGDVGPGLRIQGFRLTAGAVEGTFDYELTLIQLQRNDRFVNGVIEIEVEGVEDGTSRRLPLAKLVEGDARAVKFRFKYFQHLDGTIRVPDGFAPRRVHIRAVTRGKGQPPDIEETFEWPV